MSLDDMNQAAANRHRDALGIQAGACNLSGVARALVRAINACREDGTSDTMGIRNDAAVRLIVHQMAFLANCYEIDHTSDVYGQLTDACQVRSVMCDAEKEAVACERPFSWLKDKPRVPPSESDIDRLARTGVWKRED